MRQLTELTVGETQGPLQGMLHRSPIACKLSSAERGCLTCCVGKDAEPVSGLGGKEGEEEQHVPGWV